MRFTFTPNSSSRRVTAIAVARTRASGLSSGIGAPPRWISPAGVFPEASASTSRPARASDLERAVVVAASVETFRSVHGDMAQSCRRLDRTSRPRERARQFAGPAREPVWTAFGTAMVRPLNDEAPEDGVDDRTFRGESLALGGGWQRVSHSSCSTPSSTNDLGLAWRPSSVNGGSPGIQNTVFTHGRRHRSSAAWDTRPPCRARRTPWW